METVKPLKGFLILFITQHNNLMKKKTLLFLPADAILNEISRSFYIAKGLSEEYNLYFLSWYDPQNRDFSLIRNKKLYTLKTFIKSIFTKINIYKHPKYNYHIVKAPKMSIMIIYRFLGVVNALKLSRFFNGFVLKKIIKKISPQILFYADGFDFFPIVDDTKIIIADIQDDFSTGNFRDNKYQQKYGSVCFNKSKKNYIVTEAAADKLSKHYNASFEFLPNGADFKGLKSINKTHNIKLKNSLKLTNKIIVSYIGGRAWVDIDFATELFRLSLEKIPNVHFIIIGNLDIINSPNVSYLGSQTNEETYKYYNLSDIGILLKNSKNSPFLENSMPLKIIQYSALNKTVITPKIRWIQKYKFLNIQLIEDYSPENVVNKLKEIVLKKQYEITEEKWNTYDWQQITKKIIFDLKNLL